MIRYKCKLEETGKKPEVCILFPRKQAEISEYPDCSFVFDEDGNRTGDCNWCGACCLTCWITPPEYSRKYKDERCPYLEKA